MRKIILTAICAIALVTGLSAQSMGKGKSVLYMGMGTGEGNSDLFYSGKTGYSYHRSPMLHIGYEYGVWEDAIPQSIIGLGPHVSTWFASQKFRNNNGDGYNQRWSDVTVLAKGFYHHKFLVGEKWDVYGIVSAGLRFRSYHYESVGNGFGTQIGDNGDIAFAGGLGVGGRFYFTRVFGVYAEFDFGNYVSAVQAGIAFKFGN